MQLGSLLHGANRELAATPAIHLPIFDAGRLRAGLDAKRADVALAVAQYDQALQQAVADVNDATVRMQGAQREAAPLAAQLRGRERDLASARVREAAGLIDGQQRLVDELVLTSLQDQELIACACRPCWPASISTTRSAAHCPRRRPRRQLRAVSASASKTREHTMTDTNTTRPAAPASANKSSRSKALLITGSTFGLAAVAYAVWVLGYAQYRESTDDAYVQANLVYVNAQVGGTVTALGADDNQPVKAGQTLVTLDHSDAAVALADAGAQLGLAVRQVREQQSAVDESQAVVAQRRTDLQRASDDLARRTQLAGTDSIAAEDLQHAKQAVAAAQDALTVAEKTLATTRAPIAGITLRQNPAVLRAARRLRAGLARHAAQRRAGADGRRVARRSVQVGQHVPPGAALLAVVPLQGAWIDANFKEPQLRHIRVGQPATVDTDLYGGDVEYHGVVASIAAGSGGAFSLLPPQNATGNWIKVVQRVPVRIALDPKELAAHPLRVGLSTDVTSTRTIAATSRSPRWRCPARTSRRPCSTRS